MTRLVGCLLVCGMALVAALRPVSSVGEAVVLGALLAAYLGAYLYARPHISAVAMGFAAALVWLDLVVVLPPVPGSIALGVGFTAAGAVATAWMTRQPAAALHTAVTGALCIVAFAWLLLTHGPARFVPRIAGPDPLAQSRIETPDGYLWLLLIGAVLALGIVVHTAVTRTRRTTREPVGAGRR